MRVCMCVREKKNVRVGMRARDKHGTNPLFKPNKFVCVRVAQRRRGVYTANVHPPLSRPRHMDVGQKRRIPLPHTYTRACQARPVCTHTRAHAHPCVNKTATKSQCVIFLAVQRRLQQHITDRTAATHAS